MFTPHPGGCALPVCSCDRPGLWHGPSYRATWNEHPTAAAYRADRNFPSVPPSCHRGTSQSALLGYASKLFDGAFFIARCKVSRIKTPIRIPTSCGASLTLRCVRCAPSGASKGKPAKPDAGGTGYQHPLSALLIQLEISDQKLVTRRDVPRLQRTRPSTVDPTLQTIQTLSSWSAVGSGFTEACSNCR